jgi:putative phage-type endonuclease
VRYAEKIGTFVHESPEWYAARRSGLGGSEIAAVLGLSPWTSKFALWHRKAGNVGEERDNAGMSWGRRLETVIAEKWAEDHPDWSMRRTGTWRSKARPWQIANPDRLVNSAAGPAGILEVKTAHGMDGWEWGESGSDDIPVYYRCQGMHYLDVFGLEFCHFAVLIGGSDYREFTIRFDPDEAEQMRKAGEEFLASLAAGRQPDIDDSTSTYRAIRELHPDIDGSEVELPEETAVQYLAACKAETSIKAWKQRTASEVLDAMGSARYALHGGERIAMRTAVRDGIPFLRPLTRKDIAA